MDAETFSFAGLWERWEKGDEGVEPFTVLTTTTSASLADTRVTGVEWFQPKNIDRVGDPKGWLVSAEHAKGGASVS